jgi:hypothetical protein
LAEQRIAILLGPVGQLLDEVLNLFPAGISESFRAAEFDGIGLYQFGIELVLADDLAEAIADFGPAPFPFPFAFCGGSFSTGFGTVPISSTEQMPIP